MGNLWDVEFTGWFISNDKPIPDAHEYVASEALESGCDAVLFVEEDVILPVGGLAAMVRLLEDGIAIAAIDYPVGDRAQGCLTVNGDGSIIWVGLGATLVSRTVLEALSRPWFTTTRGYGGQDISFCQRVLAQGMEIRAVPGMVAGHAKVEAMGRQGTNDGCHTISVRKTITRHYAETGMERATVLAAGPTPGRDVILMPWRSSGDPLRERNREFVQRWYKPLGLTIIEGDGDPDKPFNVSAARNAAAKVAGDFDVALIADSDCLPDLEVVRKAFSLARSSGQLVLVNDDFYGLTAEASAAITAGDAFQWTRRAAARMTIPGQRSSTMDSGAIVISRTSFEQVDGFDEGFTVWGWEDRAFVRDCARLVGMTRLPGMLLHLWHRPAPFYNRWTSAELVAGRQRLERLHPEFEPRPTYRRRGAPQEVKLF